MVLIDNLSNTKPWVVDRLQHIVCRQPRFERMDIRDRQIVHFGYRQFGNDKERAATIRWLASGNRRYLLLPEDALGECLMRERLVHVGCIHRADWRLAGADSVKSDCGVGLTPARE